MNIDQIREYATRNAQNFVPSAAPVKETTDDPKSLLERKKFLEAELVRMRKRRYEGMDDDRAEDIVEDLYRELLAVEKELGDASGR